MDLQPAGHVTGLVEGVNHQVNSFNPERKLQCLELLKTHWPKIGKVCKIIGINRTTFYNHYNQDSAFKTLVDDIRDDRMEDIESVMQDNATNPMGFLDRMATLRAYKPHLYNPASKVIIERQDTLSVDAANDRVLRLRDVIDADIVETYDKRNLPPATPS